LEENRVSGSLQSIQSYATTINSCGAADKLTEHVNAGESQWAEE